jgi:hypothetical protein
MVPINLGFLSENKNFNIKVSGSLCVLRYYTINRRGQIKYNKKGKNYFFSNFDKFRKKD